MTYQTELLMQQRMSELRQANASRRLPATSRSHTGPSAARASLGRALVRVGDRLAQPAGVPAHR
jgi:hypothetical protein